MTAAAPPPRKLKSRLIRSSVLLAGFAVIYLIFWAFSIFINDPLDQKLLLLGNPDQYVPVLDELMILVTDFSVSCLAVAWIAWMVSYYLLLLISRFLYKKRPLVAKVLKYILFGLGLYFAVRAAAGWATPGYTLTGVYFPLGFILIVSFWWAGTSLVRLSPESQRRFAMVFWMTMVSVLLTNGIATDSIKDTVQRPRPLHDSNKSWNGVIRQLPDEIVRGGFSYPSGHSSSLFALVTPWFWATRKRWLKAPLLLWAAIHAYSRVYTAAHYPYCILMGSMLGFAIGTWVYFLLWPYRNEKPSSPVNA